MRTTLKFEGLPELVLERAVELGLARSKTDALRMGIFSLNKEYGLVKDVEEAMAERKMMNEELLIRRSGKRYLSEKEALSGSRFYKKKISGRCASR